MNLVARPWLVDFHAAAALDSFLFFWVLRSGFFSLGGFLHFKVRVWGVSYLIGMGHGMGNRGAKLRHRTVGFSCSFLFRPADALFRPEPGGRPG